MEGDTEYSGIHSDSFLLGKKKLLVKILFMEWCVVMDIKYSYIVLALKEILEHNGQKWSYSTLTEKKGTAYNP